MKTNLWSIVSFLMLVAGGCHSDHSPKEQGLQFSRQGHKVPTFNADTAYAKLAQQVHMGPRNPGSKGHRQALSYLTKQLKVYAGSRNVFIQHFKHIGYQGDSLKMANIIAAFNPQSTDRIMLCAHWDTRPRAEHDPNHPNQPILGADDGASGVGVLLELARVFHQHKPPIGVDIVLFDGEDYGKENDISDYFLGSRYWSNHPPVKDYRPRFSILLDMVGGEHAQFPKEANSMQSAPNLVNEIWKIADQKGYDSLFVNKKGAPISDDDLPISSIRNIPSIDIIDYSMGANGKANFPSYWHTLNDNLNIIDKHTLKGVGSVLTSLIYNRI